MASTVNTAFTEFLREVVNLDPDDSEDARASRNWLREQLHAFDDKHVDFPRRYTGQDIDFGSFARKTKIRELDDIDLIHCLMADGATYTDFGHYLTINTVPESRLSDLCFQDSNLLSSTRILNKFKKHLDEVPQYRAADVKRSGQAVTLELTSYAWNFDIVPGFFTTRDANGRTYYVIPNGEGHWMKTDPRIDRERVSKVNLKHCGRMLESLRLMKFWNRRHTAPSVPSYAFENMVLSHYEGRFDEACPYVDLEVPKVLEYVAIAIYQVIQDPKGIQGDLNTLELAQRTKVSDRAIDDARKAREAWTLELKGDHKGSIGKWRDIFGPSFPNFSE